MIMRCKFTKVGDIAYISHLDILNVLHRGINRSGIKIKYSEGFNPHPKLAFSPALSLGVDSVAEYVDIELDEVIEPNEFLERLNKVLPAGIEILKAKEYIDKKSLSAQISHNVYKFVFSKEENDLELLEKTVKAVEATDEILVEKTDKKGKSKTYNQKEKIFALDYEKGKNEHVLIAILQNSPEGALKAKEFMSILNEKAAELGEESEAQLNPSEIIKMASGAIVDGKVLEVL